MAKAPVRPPQAIQAGQTLQPSFNVTALAELEGSPFLLSADGKGSLSCWDVSPSVKSKEPFLIFEAHDAGINQVLQLKSRRLPEQLEEALWNGEPAEAEPEEAPAECASPKSSASPKLKTTCQAKSHWRELVSPPPKKTSCWSRCCCCCCCCCSSNSGSNSGASHWLVATGSEDRRLVLWLFKRSAEPRSPCPLEVAQISEWTSLWPIADLVELHDGLLAMSFRQSHEVKLFDPSNATVPWVLYGHTAVVTAFAECGDGRLATGGADGVLRVWEKRVWIEEDSPKEKPELTLQQLAATSDGAAPPELAQEAWSADAKPGVCSMAFYAHHQQAQRAEAAVLQLRVLVHSARNLPKADSSRLRVACSLVDLKEETPARTESSRSGTWNETLTVPFRRQKIGAKEELPECSTLHFEVVAGQRSSKKEKSQPVLARCSVPLAEVLSLLETQKELKPRARKLYSPLGQGPHEELLEAELLVGFAFSTSEALAVKIQSIQGMEISMTRPLYIRAFCQQSCTGAAGSALRRLQHETALTDASKPQWSQILQFQVPVYIGDFHVSYSPDYRLHFQVLSQEKALAELWMPLSTAMEECRVKHFELKPPGAKPEAKATGSLGLAFQAVLPSRKQLRCFVEGCAQVKYEGDIKNNLQVRMQMVEGDPMVSCEAVRTTWKTSTTKPVWKQKCSLKVPEELVLSGRTLAVRKGWVHEHRDASGKLAVCVDIYDRHGGQERFLRRGSVPFLEAWEAASKSKGFSPTKTVDLTPSEEGKLQLSFMINTGKDQLIVNVVSADQLPGRDPSGVPDPYCVVRFAYLNHLGEPTDQASTQLEAVTTGLGLHDESKGTLSFHHEEVLDLPGAFQDGTVAARATWHMKFDILDTKKQVVLCSSSVSVLEVLNEICASEGGDPISNLTIRERLEETMSHFQLSPSTDPFADEERCQVVRRKLIMKQLDKPFQKATEQGEMEATKPRASQAVQALAAFVSGSKDGPERQDLGTDGMELFVSFQVVSRWRGYGRSRCPPSRYMEGPSPIRCLATLSSSVVAGYEDGNVFVWDVTGQSPAPLHQFQAHRVPVSAMAVVPPLNCVITAGEARNGLEGFSESLLRLWSSVSLELRQSVSLHGQVARCLLPLALGAQVDEIMQQAQAAGKSLEKREKAVPPCLAVGTDSRQLKQVRLLRLTLD